MLVVQKRREKTRDGFDIDVQSGTIRNNESLSHGDRELGSVTVTCKSLMSGTWSR